MYTCDDFEMDSERNVINTLEEHRSHIFHPVFIKNHQNIIFHQILERLENESFGVKNKFKSLPKFLNWYPKVVQKFFKKKLRGLNSTY